MTTTAFVGSEGGGAWAEDHELAIIKIGNLFCARTQGFGHECEARVSKIARAGESYSGSVLHTVVLGDFNISPKRFTKVPRGRFVNLFSR